MAAATLSLSAFGLPAAVHRPFVADAATPSCTKFFESDIEGWAVDFAYGPRNRLWLTESFSPALLRGVSPGGGADVSFTLGSAGSANRIADPQGITVGRDGRLWIIGRGDQKIGAVHPNTGALSTWSLPGGPTRIATGADGNLWVTLNTANAIAQVDISGNVLATYPAGTGPWDITSASDGALWFTEQGAAKIGRLTIAGVLTEYVIGAPAHDITANGIDLWFTERAASKVGHLTLAGVLLSEIATPTVNSGPTGIAVGADGGVWFTEHNAAKIGRLDPASGTINETIITTSSQPPAPIIALPTTADGTIWFGIEAPHLEHFKPNPDGTVGPLPPAIALTPGTPVQIVSGGPVYSTRTTFTIGPSTPNPCVDSVSYRYHLVGSPVPATYTTVTGTTATFTLPSSGTFIVDFFATGPGGTSIPQASTIVVDQSLFVSDTTPPVLTVPGNITVPATGVSGAAVTFTATAVDAKDGAVTPTCNPPSGSTFPIGVTTVTCTAADRTGNTTAPATFTVTVTAGPPVVTGPGNLVVAAATGATTPVTFTVTAISPWGGSVAVTCTPPGTMLASPGTFVASFTNNISTTVTCVSAKDGFNQTGSVSFSVTPVTPPVLRLPANITVNATGLTTPVTFSATATGPGGASVPVVCTPTSGSGFAVGTTLISCVANDRGITTSGSFNVTVNAPRPTLTLPADITTIIAGPTAVVTYTVAGASVVDGPLLPVCVPPSGSTFPLGATLVTCTVTDLRGVSTSGTFKITLTNTVTRPTTLTITSLPILQQGASNVSAKLLGPGRTPIAGRMVTFAAGTATATGVTNASGVATATLTLVPGHYVLNASFAGDASYSAATAKAPLLVYASKDKDGKDKDGKDSGSNDGKSDKGSGKD